MRRVVPHQLYCFFVVLLVIAVGFQSPNAASLWPVEAQGTSICGQMGEATAVTGGSIRPVLIPVGNTPIAVWDYPHSPGSYARVFDPQIAPLNPPFNSQEFGLISHQLIDRAAHEKITGEVPNPCSVTVAITPLSGPPGTTVSITGTSWPYPGDIIAACDFTRCGREIPVDSAGNFSAAFIVPQDASPGEETLTFDSTLGGNYFAVNFYNFTVTSTPSPTPPPSGTTWRIETGSTTPYTDRTNNIWQADAGFVGGNIVDRGPIQIADTDDDRIYQTERWGMSGYKLPVVNGSYAVNLHFAETNPTFTRAGKRIFNVNVEGRQLNNLDIFAQVGQYTPLVKTFYVQVADGELTISFTKVVENPEINGIEVIPQPALRIEAGSDHSYTDRAGNLWQADTGFVGGNIVDRGSIEIANTDDDRIYQTERWSMSAYKILLANGNYTVKLHFAETNPNFTRAGIRIFNVNVEGQTLNNLDVFAQAGGQYKPLIKTFNVQVADGELTISFTRVVENPEINGIEVIPQASPPPTQADIRLTNFTLADTVNDFPASERTYVLKQNKLWLQVTNKGQSLFNPPGGAGNYTLQIVLKRPDHETQQQVLLPRELLPTLKPGESKNLLVHEQLFFFKPVPRGELEVSLKLDPVLLLPNPSLSKQIIVDENPTDIFVNCAANVGQAVILVAQLACKTDVKCQLLFAAADLATRILKCASDKSQDRGKCLATECTEWALSQFIQWKIVKEAGEILALLPGLLKDIFSNDPPACVKLVDLVNAWLHEALRKRFPVNGIVTESPVYPLVTNQAGQRTGFLSNGQIVQEIPDSHAVLIGEKRILLYPGEIPIKLKITGYAVGTMNLTATFAQPQETGITLSYKNVQVAQGMSATLTSNDNHHMLEIDSNGDGKVDQSRSPDMVEYISPDTYVYLPLVQR